MSVRKWEQKLYPLPEQRDPVGLFLRRLDAYINSHSALLDLGAGAGKNRYLLRGKVARIVGVDLDPRVAENPLVDEGIIAQPGPLPFADQTFDVVFSIYVLEHVDAPCELVREIHRVLRPGGFFLALTPNSNHYVALLARLTPTSFHKWLNKHRGREEEDTFPTVYRMNTRGKLRDYFAKGFECVSLDTIEVEPNYLKFWTPAFLVGALYERLVNATEWLAPLRVNIIGVFRKVPQ